MKIFGLALLLIALVSAQTNNECSANQDCYDVIGEGVGYCCGDVSCYTAGRRGNEDTNIYTQICYQPGDLTASSSDFPLSDTDATCTQTCNSYDGLSAASDGGDGGEGSVALKDDNAECKASSECSSNCCGGYELTEFPEVSEVSDVSVSSVETSDVSVSEMSESSFEMIYYCVSDDVAETMSIEGYKYEKRCSANSFGKLLATASVLFLAVSALF